MKPSDLSRRDFSKFAAAALGGVLIGVANVASAADEESPLLKEPHVCCGLNTCKGKNGEKDNDCAGTGHCASAKKHSCHGENDCKGQGGCGEHPGENTCKGKGECNVPLKEKSWKKARTRFEALMKEEKKEFGPAPKPATPKKP